MSYYVNQKCGSCGKSLTGGYVPNYSGVGQPFVVCDRCGTHNNNSDRITEWELKSRFSKIYFVTRHVASVVFLWGAGAAILAVVLMGAEVITSLMAAAALVGASLIVGLGLFFMKLSEAIMDSDSRMRNPEYVAKLRALGIAR